MSITRNVTAMIIRIQELPLYEIGDLVIFHPKHYPNPAVGTILGILDGSDCPCGDEGWHYQVAVHPDAEQDLDAAKKGTTTVGEAEHLSALPVLRVMMVERALRTLTSGERDQLKHLERRAQH